MQPPTGRFVRFRIKSAELAIPGKVESSGYRVMNPVSHFCPKRRLSLGIALALCGFVLDSATGEELEYPISVAVHESGSVYLADRNLPGVWKLDGDQLSLLFKGSKKFRTPLNAVRCVAIDASGKLLAGDSATRDIYRLADDGTPKPLTDQGEGYGMVGNPMGIAVDDEGNLLVSDLEVHRILKIPKEGGKAEEFASIQAPRGLFYDSNKQLWVISGRKLLRLNEDGNQETVVDTGVFEFPHSVVVLDDGTAYVSDGYADTIWKVAPGQKPEKWVTGEPLVNPVGLAARGKNLLVVDPAAKAVFEIDQSGKLTKRDAKTPD
jgi:sugar lactone lactonase YvrE